ncbi:MAG: helix-turn-helix domain-containing protein [Ectothiorhodospiraceae bacterium]|nr:helix-turn-helix domain-containing protein [Ectothiorhodospiraceae bacterium]MCH8506589.1 helix-turn-helix domain-containing protein [Ectothiorhodospiraceae bacterium]
MTSEQRQRTVAKGRQGESAPAGTLARGLSILHAMLEAPQPMTLVDIAAFTRLDQSTALRLLRTLEEQGYVIRIGKRYAASPLAMQPLPLMHPLQQFRREAQPVLADLASRLQETVVLVLFMGLERMVVDIAQSPGSLTPYYDNWLHGPVHASGAGKALLLGSSAERRDELLGREPYQAATPQTLTTRAALDEDLAEARERGFVISRDEHYQDLTAVSALIPTWKDQPIGCLAVTGYSRSFDQQRLADVGEELSRTARLLLYQAPSLRSLGHFVGA